MNEITFDRYKSLLCAFAMYFQSYANQNKVDTEFYFHKSDYANAHLCLDNYYKYLTLKQWTMTLFECADNQERFDYWCKELLKEKEL